MTGANPDLPILDELGAEFASLVETEFGRSHQRERIRPLKTSPTRRSRGARRVARRSSLVLVLLCLVGGVALAARFGAGEKAMNTSPTVIGNDAAGKWQLSAYRNEGRLCLAFTSAGEPSSKCGPELSPSGLRATSAIADRRFVIGLTGPRVHWVRVAAGATAVRTATRPVAEDDDTKGAGVPEGTRWFVVPLARGQGGLPVPAVVQPLDVDGRRLGAPYVDCSLGVVGSKCLSEIRSRAADATR
ncbi:MAG TPA: hypothetical protein VFI03_11100 [Solirubrobacterales bacterium]|nr:hypothetical protein [Solirubrobacterales bacterium]